MGFKGFALGKTTAETTLEIDEDIQDIIYQQDGTKASDHVSTGVDLILTATFGEINTGILNLLLAEVSSIESAGADSGHFTRNLFQSLRASEAGPLRVASTGPDGCALEGAEDTLYFYEAIPLTNGSIANWVSDAQRNLPVQFRIKANKQGTDPNCKYVFGYWGDPTAEGVEAVVWPDVSAPVLQSATVDDATDISVVFNEDLAFQGGSFPAGSVVADVDGVLVLATGGAIATDTATFTFPASTFSAGDVVKITISGACLEDTDATANVYGGVSGLVVDNPLV
jgi:hypothetical protein